MRQTVQQPRRITKMPQPIQPPAQNLPPTLAHYPSPSNALSWATEQTSVNGHQPLLMVAGPTAQCGTKTAALPSQIHPLRAYQRSSATWNEDAAKDDRVFKKQSMSSEPQFQVSLADPNILEELQFAERRRWRVQGANVGLLQDTKVSTTPVFHSLIWSPFPSPITCQVKSARVAYTGPGSRLLSLAPWNTFFHVNIIDHFLSTRVVSQAKLQLVGIVCLLLATKLLHCLCHTSSTVPTLCVLRLRSFLPNITYTQLESQIC